MTHRIGSHIGTAVLLAIGAAGLASCGEPASDESASASDEIGLVASDARLVLPAVEGNPAAVYFNLTHNGAENVVVRAASVSGAERAELHEMSEWSGEMVMGEMAPMMLEPGANVTFEPGAKHVMAFGLAPDIAAGSEVEVTLTVLGGDKYSFTAPVQSAGDDR